MIKNFLMKSNYQLQELWEQVVLKDKKKNFSILFHPFYTRQLYIDMISKLNLHLYFEQHKLKDLIQVNLKLDKYFIKVKMIQLFLCLLLRKKEVQIMDLLLYIYMDMVVLIYPYNHHLMLLESL